ncbi:hypothetical protein GYMLUDRAFT_261297 [Collybiopsis luxurians FD-317 M1]|uniref:Uncharacterized protein n=1 Tax=Collybiopsis luxurians FD-317 M1 TaxID=944289 RepID=A0A0D0CX22_9AGAR|nr:hypothetical protein GYMLUDRAFT_261297 [Collybiopsis luxurians FD-317 M1]
MSDSSSPPAPFHRGQEKLINSDEAKEDKLINILAEQLEQLRADKIELQNAPKAESNIPVRRLGRPRSSRAAPQNKKPNDMNRKDRVAVQVGGDTTRDPSTEVMLDNINLRRESERLRHVNELLRHENGQLRHENGRLRKELADLEQYFSRENKQLRRKLANLDSRENEQLRKKLADIERDYTRVSRLNDCFREELIHHGNRLGQPVSDLFRMHSPMDEFTGSSTSPRHFDGVPIPPPLARSQDRFQDGWEGRVVSQKNSGHPASRPSGFMLGPELLSSFPSRMEAQIKMAIPNVSARSSGPTADALQVPSN